MSVDEKRNIADEQHQYLESLLVGDCENLEKLSQSSFVENPEPRMLCEISASLLDSTDWYFVTWMPENRAPVLHPVHRSDGFPEEEGLMEKIVQMVEQPEEPSKNSSEGKLAPLGSSALLEVGFQRILCIGFQQTICDKKFKYALAITGRRRPPLESAPHTQYLSYDEFAIKPFLAVCLTFLKTRIEVTHAEFYRACDNRAPGIAVETGASLFNLKDRWDIPAAADAVKRFLEAYLALVSQPREVHRRDNWKGELQKIRDVYVKKCDGYEKLKKPLHELLARIVTACLIASDLGTFDERLECVDTFVEGGEIKWPQTPRGFA